MFSGETAHFMHALIDIWNGAAACRHRVRGSSKGSVGKWPPLKYLNPVASKFGLPLPPRFSGTISYKLHVKTMVPDSITSDELKIAGLMGPWPSLEAWPLRFRPVLELPLITSSYASI